MIEALSKVFGGIRGKDKAPLRPLFNALRTSLLFGSATYDAANLVDAAGATGTITVTGAALGDFVVGLSFGVDLQGITATGYVSAANTVSFRLQNESGGAIDLASTTVRAVVAKRDHYDGTAIFGLRA
jgi:spore coat protein U-like protein